MSIIEAMENAHLISQKKAHAMNHILDRLTIINNQLSFMYRKPAFNSIRIANLEKQKNILEGA